MTLLKRRAIIARMRSGFLKDPHLIFKFSRVLIDYWRYALVFIVFRGVFRVKINLTYFFFLVQHINLIDDDFQEEVKFVVKLSSSGLLARTRDKRRNLPIPAESISHLPNRKSSLIVRIIDGSPLRGVILILTRPTSHTPIVNLYERPKLNFP